MRLTRAEAEAVITLASEAVQMLERQARRGGEAAAVRNDLHYLCEDLAARIGATRWPEHPELDALLDDLGHYAHAARTGAEGLPRAETLAADLEHLSGLTARTAAAVEAARRERTDRRGAPDER